MRKFIQISHSSVEHYLVIKSKLGAMEQDDDFQSEKLNTRTAHRAYLVMYSQADSTMDLTKSKSYIGLATWKTTRTMLNITIFL